MLENKFECVLVQSDESGVQVGVYKCNKSLFYCYSPEDRILRKKALLTAFQTSEILKKH